ncbi:Helicase associated domain protein [Streptomyces sp. GTA36]
MADLVPYLASGAAGRIAPVEAEMTLSFLSRVAARYHLHVKDLLAAITTTGHLPNVKGQLRPDSEVHLNAEARARVARLCRVTPSVLERALPAWTREEPRGRRGSGPGGRLLHGEEAVTDWGPACPACTAARTGRTVPARRYLAPEQRVCPRHRYWLLSLPGTGGLPVQLAGCPEVVEAHRRHRRLLRRNQAAAQAFAIAQAVTGRWWEQNWPRQERIWPLRLHAVRPAGTDPRWWKAAARDLVTYPDTVALAGLLASTRAQQQITRDAHGHVPYRLGDLPWLLEEVARRLERPWLAEHLRDVTHGPLFAWAHTLARTAGAGTPAAQRALWKIPAPHRPRPLYELLPASRSQLPSSPTTYLRGYGRRTEQAFEQGLAHARSYHLQHGHLIVPIGALHEGHPLGIWLSNQRARHVRMPERQFTALAALDPYWNAPWNQQWQRPWHQASQHTRTHGPLDAAAGFPGVGIGLGEWLYEQCTRHQVLHPQQRHLLAGLGIDTRAAQTARPPRRGSSERFQRGLAHATAYAAHHGQLATISESTLHNGFPLGTWLARLRNRHSSRPPVPADRVQALTAIDPWWNPPWNLYWQRHYYRARTAVTGQTLNPTNGFDDLDDAGIAAWLRRQCRDYPHLHPQQKDLLAGLGLTPDAVHTAQHDLRLRTPPDRIRHRAAGGALMGHRPDQRVYFETALTHARAYAAQHGHLAVPRDTLHDGFPLGRWLASQRTRASIRARRNLPASPHTTELTAIDPWWNPPWKTEWQRNYHRALDYIHAGKPFDPAHRIPHPSTAIGSWINRARRRYHHLHPDQQHLLTTLGIHPSTYQRSANRPLNTPADHT